MVEFVSLNSANIVTTKLDMLFVVVVRSWFGCQCYDNGSVSNIVGYIFGNGILPELAIAQ